MKQKRKNMKRYCISVKDVVEIILQCPNCGKKWNLTKNAGMFLDIDNESRLLFCGECEVDLDKVRKKIAHRQIKLKLMPV